MCALNVVCALHVMPDTGDKNFIKDTGKPNYFIFNQNITFNQNINKSN